jgi:hypothetical protein
MTPSKCNSHGVFLGCKKSIAKVVFLRFLKQSRVHKVKWVDRVASLESRANLAGCSQGLGVVLVRWEFQAQSQLVLSPCHFLVNSVVKMLKIFQVRTRQWKMVGISLPEVHLGAVAQGGES